MVHRISTEPGQSGAPVIRTDQAGNLIIIGIHIGNTEKNIKKYQDKFPQLKMANRAKVLNEVVIKRIAGFADKLKGEIKITKIAK